MNEDCPFAPELLQAYFDGELDDRADCEMLRRRIEAWVAENSAGQEEQAAHQALRELWHETRPAEPAADDWNKVLAGLQDAVSDKTASRHEKRRVTRRRVGWLGASVAAAALVLVFLPRADRPAPALRVEVQAVQEVEVFEVAHADEITIIRVEGADTQTVVVGELPVRGLLELLGPGDVTLTRMEPHGPDNMVPSVRLNENAPPLIWARIDSDGIDP